MKQFITLLIIIAVVVGLYYFIKSVQKDVIDPELQHKCDEVIALTRFSSEEARNQFYQNCLDGKIK